MKSRTKKEARSRLYVGAPRSGKSTLALTHARELGRVALLVDPRRTLLENAGPVVGGRVAKWSLPRARNLDEVWHRLYRTREGCVYTPPSLEDFEDLCAGALTERTGGISFVFDEWGLLCTGSWTPRALADGIRTCAHVDVDFFITTQYPQDLHPRIRNCILQVYGFTNLDKNAQKVLGQWFPDPEKFGTLPSKTVRIWPF